MSKNSVVSCRLDLVASVVWNAWMDHALESHARFFVVMIVRMMAVSSSTQLFALFQCRKSTYTYAQLYTLGNSSLSQSIEGRVEFKLEINGK